MGGQEAQASAATPTAPLELLGPVLGGRGPGTSVTGLGPPSGPLLEPILGQLGSLRGAIQRQGPAPRGP